MILIPDSSETQVRQWKFTLPSDTMATVRPQGFMGPDEHSAKSHKDTQEREADDAERHPG